MHWHGLAFGNWGQKYILLGLEFFLSVLGVLPAGGTPLVTTEITTSLGEVLSPLTFLLGSGSACLSFVLQLCYEKYLLVILKFQTK